MNVLKSKALKVLKKLYKYGVFKSIRPEIASVYNAIRDPSAKDKINKKINEFDLDHMKNFIFFLVPSRNIVNGGVMSIFSLFSASKNFFNIHHSLVILATFPDVEFTPVFNKFYNNEIVVPFNLIMKEIKQIENIVIHVPEYYVPKFINDLSISEKDKIEHSSRSILNILNQNNDHMPGQHFIKPYRKIFNEITCTTAHKQYCTRENRNYYNIPFHHFSAENLFSNYKFSEYIEKDDLLIFSPDNHPMKHTILEIIKTNFPKLNLVEIWNYSYSEYLELCSKAKWSITFGEGLDGYFIEPVKCGGCSFAVFNKTFFTEEYQNLEVIFNDYEDMLHNICNRMKYFDNKNKYKEINTSILDIINAQYSRSEYFDNIKEYYLGNYLIK